MKIITIELLSDEALNLILHLEKLQILRLVNESNESTHSRRNWVGTLSKETASKMLELVNETRNEWGRNS